jgi:hypothetical protein
MLPTALSTGAPENVYRFECRLVNGLLDALWTATLLHGRKCMLWWCWMITVSNVSGRSQQSVLEVWKEQVWCNNQYAALGSHNRLLTFSEMMFFSNTGPSQPEHVPFYSNKIRRSAPTVALEQPEFTVPRPSRSTSSSARLGPPPLMQVNELDSCKNRLSFWDP